MKGTELVGRLLGGRYRVRGLLGAGGMGAVYEAVQEDLGRRVALKVLLASNITNEDLRRFRREALAASQLGHPNIVQVTDFQAPPGEPPFLVMERLDGESLKDVLQRERRLAPGRAVFIASQVLAALTAAHAAGIVHRDIKPPNILLSRTQVMADLAKVLDFGIAKAPSLAGSFRTSPDTILGTPAYMAPEQATGGEVDHRADLYAVGACLFEMLAGRRPYLGSAGEVIAQLTRGSPPVLRELRPELDPALSALVDRALSRAPAARFPTALSMLQALAPWSRGSDASGPALDERAAGPAVAPPPEAPTLLDPAPLTRAENAPPMRSEPRAVVGAPPPDAFRPRAPQGAIGTAPRAGTSHTGLFLGLAGAAAALLIAVGVGLWLALASAKKATPTKIEPLPSSSDAMMKADYFVWFSEVVVVDDLVGDAAEDVVGIVRFLNDPSVGARLAVLDGASSKRVWLSPPLPDNGVSSVFGAASRRVAIAHGRTVRLYTPASGAVGAELTFDGDVRQLCRPRSGDELWAEISSGESVLLDLVHGTRRVAHEPPAGCAPARTSPDIPSRSGSRAPQVAIMLDGARAHLLIEGNFGVGTVRRASGEEELVGVELRARENGSVFAARELWRVPTAGAASILEVEGGRAYVRRSATESHDLECLDAKTGTSIWRTPLGVSYAPGRSTMTITRSAYVMFGVKLLVFDPKTGTLLGELGYR